MPLLICHLNFAIHLGADDMADSGSDIIRTIKNFAETSNNPNVYNLAQIPAPQPAGPTPPPGRPFELTVGLLQTGAVELKWKCENPAGTSGTVYEVQRRIGNGPFNYVGVTGTRSFTDDTLPLGSSSIIYQITAIRSTQNGPAAQFVVNFGVQGVTATAIEPTASRRCAAHTWARPDVLGKGIGQGLGIGGGGRCAARDALAEGGTQLHKNKKGSPQSPRGDHPPDLPLALPFSALSGFRPLP
jgi:hypothetical protein